MIAKDSVTVTTVVRTDPADAFRLFTAEIDSWWKRGSRYRFVRLEIAGNKVAKAAYIYNRERKGQVVGTVTSATGLVNAYPASSGVYAVLERTYSIDTVNFDAAMSSCCGTQYSTRLPG